LKKLIIHWPLPSGEGVYVGDIIAWHITPLEQDSKIVFRTFKHTQTQQPIIQAEKAGVFIKQSQDWGDVLKFYNLHLKTRKRLGTPIQPILFFRLLWERLIARELGFILLAYQGEQLLAGAVFLHWNRTLTYKYSASEPQFWRFKPNNLILWHAIRWGCEHGYSIFDWGKTDIDNQGLRKFKLGWGSQEKILNYSILMEHDKFLKPTGSLQKSLMKFTIQHSPVWFCRLIGEMLYGHFA